MWNVADQLCFWTLRSLTTWMCAVRAVPTDDAAWTSSVAWTHTRSGQHWGRGREGGTADSYFLGACSSYFPGTAEKGRRRFARYGGWWRSGSHEPNPYMLVPEGREAIVQSISLLHYPQREGRRVALPGYKATAAARATI